MVDQYRSFSKARDALRIAFKTRADTVHPQNWQGVDVSKRPEMRSQELLMESFKINLGGVEDLDHWRHDIQPNLPWADDHFEERVCGCPINPGKTWEYWPWAESAEKSLNKSGMFNHNYMERLWPRFAAKSLKASKTVEEFQDGHKQFQHSVGGYMSEPNFGIWGEYGDLGTLVDKLAWDPSSRQIVIPLFFPEDTGASGRMPCTLLYQFIRRGDRLHIYYPLRSCDFIRHWSDDCYLAVRLLLWVLQECRKRNFRDWDNVEPGEYVMHMTSLHIFENDRSML